MFIINVSPGDCKGWAPQMAVRCAAKVRDALLCKAPTLDGGLILHENPFHLSGYAI